MQFHHVSVLSVLPLSYRRTYRSFISPSPRLPWPLPHSRSPLLFHAALAWLPLAWLVSVCFASLALACLSSLVCLHSPLLAFAHPLSLNLSLLALALLTLLVLASLTIFALALLP